MKKTTFFLSVIVLANVLFAQEKIKFDDYFLPKTLRFDYIHAGNSSSETIYFEKLKEEPHWGGSQTNTINPYNYGEYRYLVYDYQTDKLIFSQTYATLFQEWQATEEAKNTDRSFYETIIMPFPKAKIKLVIQKRDKKNNFENLYETEISPDNYFIIKEQKYKFATSKIIDNGKPEKNVDVVIIAEGYTADEMEKFRKDAQRFADGIFKYSPFNKHKNKFNIHTVEAISDESGTDIPGENIWKNTVLNSHFYTFGTERYITTPDVETLRDVAALVPYDQIYILANTDKYGGGGIFNFYNLCVSDHSAAELVFVHEFGHGFGGLADEYWTSDVAVQEYYDLSVEPADPNITTLVDFESKWKHMVDKKTPIPTPATNKFKNKVGAFEGGGYVEKGIYRPAQNCYMKSLSAKDFCPVCQDALEKMILFYTE